MMQESFEKILKSKNLKGLVDCPELAEYIHSQGKNISDDFKCDLYVYHEEIFKKYFPKHHEQIVILSDIEEKSSLQKSNMRLGFMSYLALCIILLSALNYFNFGKFTTFTALFVCAMIPPLMVNYYTSNGQNYLELLGQKVGDLFSQNRKIAFVSVFLIYALIALIGFGLSLHVLPF